MLRKPDDTRRPRAKLRTFQSLRHFCECAWGFFGFGSPRRSRGSRRSPSGSDESSDHARRTFPQRLRGALSSGLGGYRDFRDRAMLTMRHPMLECLESRDLLSITANADNYSMVNTAPLVVAAPGVLGNDVDSNGYTMTAVLRGQATNGTVQLNSDGGFTYTPNPGFFGTDSFTYYATDQTHTQSIAHVTIGVNVGATAVDDATKMPVDTLDVSRQILSDPWSQPIVSPLPAGGSGGTSISAEPADGAPATAHNLSLVYDSVAGHPDQVLEGDFQVDVAAGSMPQTLTASATFNGSAAGTSYISTSGVPTDPTIHVAIQVDTSALPSGRYPYSLTLSAANSASLNGFVNVVNDSASPFGMGWDMPGLYHVYQNNVQGVPAGVLLTPGDGTGWYFTSAGGNTYTSPSGPYAFDTLTSVNGGGWQLADKYGTVFDFNANGFETSRIERTLETTSYAWTNGDLTSIADGFGRPVELGYTNGLLSSIQDYAGSTWAFAHTGSDLTSITLPNPGSGSPVWTYAYSGNYLSSVTDPNSNQTSFVLNSEHRLQSTSLPGGASTSAVSEQNYGYGGPSGNPDAAVLTSSVLPSTTDANQNTSDYQSDTFGDPTSEIDPYGNVTAIQRDANGLPTQITLPPPASGDASPVTTISYDGSGNETSASGAQPTYGTWTFNGFGEWATFTDSTGKEWVRTFDSHGNVLTETDPLSNQVSWTYDPYGRPLTMTVPAPNNGTGTETTHYFYDSYERLVQITWVDNSTEVLGYDSDDRQKSFTDENDHTTTTHFDALGRVVSIVNAANGTVSFTYDNDNNRLTTTDEMNDVTTDQFNARNELVQETLPAPAAGQAAPVLVFSYDANGNELTYTDALNRVTSLAWDKLDRMTSDTLPPPAAGKASPVIATAYDNLSRKTSETNALSGTTTWAYANTDISQVTSETLPPPSGSGAGLITSYGYDADGRQDSVTDATNHTSSTSFTADGQISQTEDNLKSITSYAYGHLGELLSTTDPLNHTSSDQYDSRFRLVQSTDANNGVTSITLDPAGNQTKLVDPDNNATSWTFDALNRPVTEANSLGTTTVGYDALSDVTSIQDADGRVRYFTFDNLHRLTAENWMNGSTVVATMSYGFDLDNELTSASDPNSAYAFSYDGDGNVLTVDNAGTPNVPHVVLTNTFDLMGDRASQSASIAGTLDYLNNYSYDADQRLAMVQQQDQSGGNTVAPKEVDFGYNALGQYTSIAYFNTLSTPRSDVATGAYTYDGDNRLTGLAYTSNAGANMIDTFGWTFDNASRVTTFTSNDGTATYGYDPTNQLTSAAYTSNSGGHEPANESYSFDLNGNRNSTGYATGGDNLMTSDGTFNYQHDADGNQTVRTRISNAYAADYKTTYSWDYRNRLTDVEYFDNNNVLTKHAHFVYGVFDHLTATEVDTTGGGSYNQIAHYVLDVSPETPQAGVPGNILAQPVLMFDGNGNPTERVLEATDRIFAEGAVSSPTVADTIDWDLVDNLGSLRYVLNNNGGAIDRAVYSAFGQVAYESNPSFEHFTGFAGGHIDATTDLVNDYHRWVDPTVGHWLSQDPAGIAAGDTNLNRYCGNSPSENLDPKGLSFLGNYWYYLVHPSKMDSDLQTAQKVALATSAAAATAAGGIVIAQAVAAQSAAAAAAAAQTAAAEDALVSVTYTVVADSTIVSSEIAAAEAASGAAAAGTTVITSAEAPVVAEAMTSALVHQSAGKAAAKLTIEQMLKGPPPPFTPAAYGQAMWYQMKIFEAMTKYGPMVASAGAAVGQAAQGQRILQIQAWIQQYVQAVHGL